MDHAMRAGQSTTGFTNEVHPRRRFRRVEPEMFLQRIQRLQRGEGGLVVVFGLEYGQQAGAGLREPGGIFWHDFAVVNLDFQREIAHAETIAQGRHAANRIWQDVGLG